jgi:type IV pilus assembly protein PilX
MRNLQKQSGAVLLLALVLLMAATILALSGLNSSALQGRMVAAKADSVIALSSAEMALKRAELIIASLGTGDIASFNNTGPYYAANVAPSGNDLFTEASWAGAEAVIDNPNGIEDGQYIIELMNDSDGLSAEDIAQAANMNNSGAVEGANLFNNNGDPGSMSELTFHTFRVIALGHGRSPNTVRIVEAYYRRGFL